VVALVVAFILCLGGLLGPLYVVEIDSQLEGQRVYTLEQVVGPGGVDWSYKNRNDTVFEEHRDHTDDQSIRKVTYMWGLLLGTGTLSLLCYLVLIVMGPRLDLADVDALGKDGLHKGIAVSWRLVFTLLTAATLALPFLSMLFTMGAIPGALSEDQMRESPSTRDILPPETTILIGKQVTPYDTYFGQVSFQDSSYLGEDGIPDVTITWGGGTGWLMNLTGAILCTIGVLCTWRWFDIRSSTVRLICLKCEADFPVNVLLQDIYRVRCPECNARGGIEADMADDPEYRGEVLQGMEDEDEIDRIVGELDDDIFD